jgi:hypothetical protein
MTPCNGWCRVNRNHPCPVCERPDWCLIAADGSAAICARVESPRRYGGAGWLHRLAESPRRPERRRVRHVLLAAGGGPDLARLVAEYQRAVDPGRLHHLATSLGLTPDSLRSFGIGWTAEYRAWAFPMVGSDGQVLGIRLRRPAGFKFAVKGGREGLFLPAGAEAGNSPLLICEGPTDAAALWDMGFGAVVGRPSCTGGVKLLCELVRRWRPAEVVVVADGDEPGCRGADNLAAVLVVYVPVVRVICPPGGIKDAREWLRAGGTRADVDKAIAAAPVRRLVVWTARALS